MMRDIKFRAWNDIDKKIVAWACIKYSMDVFLASKHYQVEQYTGLKDKNGVEIYEGDIVKLNDDRIFRIEFDVNMGGWYLRAGGDGVQWHEQAVRKGRLPYEVVGNIHQNPELINA